MTIPPEERFTFTPKGQVILRGKPNKAVQVNCLFPRLSIPPLFFFFRVAGRFWIDTNILEIETWPVLYGATFYRGHKTRGNPHSSRMTVFYRISKPEKPRRRFFFKRTCYGIRLKYLSLTPWNATQDLLIADKLRCISRYQRFFSNRLIKRYDRVYSQIKRGGIKVEELFLKESLQKKSLWDF